MKEAPAADPRHQCCCLLRLRYMYIGVARIFPVGGGEFIGVHHFEVLHIKPLKTMGISPSPEFF